MRRLHHFHPPLWAWPVTLFGIALFTGLGIWQLDRGQAKEQWLAQFEMNSAAAVTLSAQTPAPASLTLQPAQATGQYLAERQLLQDGQSRAGRPGYHVWTPLRLADGGLALVNRGWIAQPFDAAINPLAAPAGEVTVTGGWRALPEPGIRLTAGECRKPASFPVVVVYPRLEQLVCLLGQSLLPGLLLMDPLTPGGYVREWSVIGIPPERHYGYAVTWFGLGLTAVFLFVRLNLKPKLNSDDPAES